MNDQYIFLEWKCRRGMLELDLIFLKFYQNGFTHLDENEKELFNKLLDESDPQLAAWIFGYEKPQDSAYINLIGKIKK